MLRVLICQGVYCFMCLYIYCVYYVKSVNMSRSLYMFWYVKIETTSSCACIKVWFSLCGHYLEVLKQVKGNQLIFVLT